MKLDLNHWNKLNNLPLNRRKKSTLRNGFETFCAFVVICLFLGLMVSPFYVIGHFVIKYW